MCSHPVPPPPPAHPLSSPSIYHHRRARPDQAARADASLHVYRAVLDNAHRVLYRRDGLQRDGHDGAWNGAYDARRRRRGRGECDGRRRRGRRGITRREPRSGEHGGARHKPPCIHQSVARVSAQLRMLDFGDCGRDVRADSRGNCKGRGPLCDDAKGATERRRGGGEERKRGEYAREGWCLLARRAECGGGGGVGGGGGYPTMG
jgi:hypothetical protein